MTTKKTVTEDLYVGLENPKDIHKWILESTKGVLKILQAYEKLKNANARKHAQMEVLKQLTEDISYQVTELKEKLPKVTIKDLPKDTPKQLKKSAAKATTSQEIQSSKVGLSKIEKELSEIEEKLRNL